MSIASRIFLAAALAAGFMLPGGAQAALQGFSIELGDPANPLTLDYNANGGLSAAAAPSNGKPAFELENNGSYKATITGDYAVFDNLPPVNEPVHWHEFYEITLNGHILFENPGAIVGPYSGDDIWMSFVHAFGQFTGKDDMQAAALLRIIVAVLEHRDFFYESSGVFDYVYNTLNQPVGTFAVGTTYDLGSRFALNATNTLSFDASLFVVPELSNWAMLLLGFAGLGFVGYRQTRRAKPQAA